MSASKGNAGEHLIMAELLVRGFDAYWADRGNPAFDISCFWNKTGRATRLRVKTTSNGTAVWTSKKTGLFLEVQPKDDFVVICDVQKGIRGATIYVVPTSLAQEHLTKNHAVYVSHPSKNGKKRNAETNIRVLRFFGEHQEDNPSYGYHQKFSSYLENWDLLK
jgi:hypothetical protein